MNIIQFTFLLTMVCILLILIFREWCKSNPLRALEKDYPVWAYAVGLLVLLDVFAILLSVIWLLFFL